MKLEHKRVVITGGTSGIGLALARALRAEGAVVLVCGRDAGRLDAALRDLPGVAGVVHDVARSSATPAFVAECVARLDGLDVLINNAGVQNDWSLGDPHLDAAYAAESFAREVAVNLVAPMQLTQFALPHLCASEDGVVVNVTSVLGWQPRPACPVYCATKAGLDSWTRSLRAQLEGRVRVVDLVPPLVETALAGGRSVGGISPREVARVGVRGLREDRTRILVGGARAAGWLDRWVPSVLARMMAR